jgi:predicted membrane protein
LPFDILILNEKRRSKMGLALALIVMGVLILLDRMGVGYGLREGWPWIVVALGIGGLFRNTKSLPAWVTTIIGIIILGARYYSIHISIPGIVKTYFLPVLLIVVGFLWLWKYKKD